jgi:hypothetical protein
LVAAGQTPAHCGVHGTVVTLGEGAPDGVATVALQLPQAWQQRFVSMGIGGNGGRLAPEFVSTDNGLSDALGLGRKRQVEALQWL